LIPVADRHIKYAEKIKSELGYRVDIDDRDETVSRKVMDAGREWIPYVAVIGDEEIKGDFLTVTIRKESGIKKTNKVKMKVSELKEKVEGETKGMPFRPLPLPVRLSKRPVFCK
jgi:threonyl-tRNA synthetase